MVMFLMAPLVLGLVASLLAPWIWRLLH